MATLERLRPDFRHANEVEFAFRNKTGQGLDCLLDRHIGVYPGALEEVELLLAAQGGVDGGYATAEVLWAEDRCCN